ncbi:unnamed protein product [Dibothriocephalus latus]|uniref:Uncharacterized protein n=1 Tax=Dibothriocephalus latus TaxID=60516 RepID=A0A3P7RFZ8_DIBLA|nr:unnamed protein product [Dibothriocephalus latus]
MVLGYAALSRPFSYRPAADDVAGSSALDSAKTYHGRISGSSGRSRDSEVSSSHGPSDVDITRHGRHGCRQHSQKHHAPIFHIHILFHHQRQFFS